MKINNTLVILFSIILVMGLASAQLIGKQNTAYDVKRTCINNGTYCSASAQCNLTIIYPDGTLLVSNALMTNKISYHNYTIANTSLTQLDTYEAIMMCTDGSLSGSETFDFLVTANGKPAPSGGVIVLFTIIFLIILGSMVFFFFSVIGHFVKMDIDIIDVAINWGIYFILIGVYTLHNFYVANPTIESMLIMIMRIGGFTNLVLPVLAFSVTLIVKKIKNNRRLANGPG